jgi:hypothetical protein
MSHRHAPDVVALVFGTILAGATAVWIVDLDGHLDRHNSWWVGPLVLMVAGIVGLVAALRPDHGTDPDEPSEITQDPSDSPLEEETAG